MINNCKDELVVKLVGKLSVEFPDMDQLQMRRIIEETLYKYNVAPTETTLITSDVEDKLHMYLAVKKLEGYSELTLKSYNLNLLIFADFMRKPLSAVTSTDLRIFLANRCQGLKATTQNTHITILKSFFKWLTDEGYIPKNPMTVIKQAKVPKRLREGLSAEELEILRQACITDREKVLVEFIFSSGCRLSEVKNIDISDINWNDKSLRVIGKGDKERRVYFSVKASLLLKKYIKSRKGDSQALFIGERAPYRRLGGRAIERAIRKIADRAGFDKHIFPHLLRHTFATHNINVGMPLSILQELLGHETGDTTMRYAKVSQENIRHAYMIAAG